MKEFHRLITEICDEEKITVYFLSKDWIVMLERDNKTKFISGYKFDLNGHALGNIMDDKYAMFDVLGKKQIPVISHQILFRPSNKNEYAIGASSYQQAYDFFRENNEDIVIKSNTGTCGSEVYHIIDISEIEPCLDKLFATNFSISLCPFYSIKAEYRVIVLRNQCMLIYGKRRPVVIGDGKRTIRELLLEFNFSYFQNRLQEELYSRILEDGEVYEYSWQFNLSQGAVPFSVSDDTICERINSIISKVFQELDLGFCSIDIVETSDDEMFVMEFNSGVMMKNYMQFVPSGRSIAKDIYKQAIREMFSDR